MPKEYTGYKGLLLAAMALITATAPASAATSFQLSDISNELPEFTRYSPESLVTCEDTQAVYYTLGGERYAFPNTNIYYSWYQDFSEVEEISCEALAQYTLAGNVRYQAGVKLLKIPSVAKVYAVETDGTLRPIKDEAQAINLYGENWAQKVDDLPETLFSSYKIGEELTNNELPEGMLLINKEGLLTRVDSNQTLVEIWDITTYAQDRLFYDLYKQELIETENAVQARTAIHLDKITQEEREDYITNEQTNKLKPLSVETYTTLGLQTPDEISEELIFFSEISEFIVGEEVLEDIQEEIDNGADYTMEEAIAVIDSIVYMGEIEVQTSEQIELALIKHKNPFELEGFEAEMQKIVDSLEDTKAVFELDEVNLSEIAIRLELNRRTMSENYHDLKVFVAEM